MNTTGLDRLYSRLDPTERYRLLMQAVARGDQAERGRILGSTPKVKVQVFDVDLRRLCEAVLTDRTANGNGA